MVRGPQFEKRCPTPNKTCLARYFQLPIPVATRSKLWVCGRSLVGIAGSNPARGHGCLSVIRQSSLFLADYSTRGVIQCVCVCVCVCVCLWEGGERQRVCVSVWGGSRVVALTTLSSSLSFSYMLFSLSVTLNCTDVPQAVQPLDLPRLKRYLSPPNVHVVCCTVHILAWQLWFQCLIFACL